MPTEMCTLDDLQVHSADKTTDLILLDHLYDQIVKNSGIFQALSCVLKPQQTENI